MIMLISLRVIAADFYGCINFERSVNYCAILLLFHHKNNGNHTVIPDKKNRLMIITKQSYKMKKAGIFCSLALLAVFVNLRAQNEVKPVNDTLAIIETAMNYGDGFLGGSGERMEKALFPDLMKLAATKLPNSDKSVLIQSTVSGLVEMSRAKIGFQEEAKRKITVTVLLINGDIACVRLNSSQFNDYLEMIRVDGVWKIVNVLWAFGPDSQNRQQVPVLNADEQKPAIEQAVRNYIEGLYLGDPLLVEKALHPRFTQATLARISPAVKPMINRDGYDLLVAYARAKMALQDRAKWNYQVKVLDYMDGMAMVQLNTPGAVSYIQAAYLDGEWKMINMLRKRG